MFLTCWEDSLTFRHIWGSYKLPSLFFGELQLKRKDMMRCFKGFMIEVAMHGACQQRHKSLIPFAWSRAIISYPMKPWQVNSRGMIVGGSLTIVWELHVCMFGKYLTHDWLGLYSISTIGIGCKFPKTKKHEIQKNLGLARWKHPLQKEGCVSSRNPWKAPTWRIIQFHKWLITMAP